MSDEQKKITITIHLVIDSAGHWIARGEGVGADSDRRDDHTPVGADYFGLANSNIGDDERHVEFMQVAVDVPVPECKVLEGRLF